jgi:myo-inositol catabolism protein IolC
MGVGGGYAVEFGEGGLPRTRKSADIPREVAQAVIPGYTKPLYLLPFDHRHSYITGMCHFTPPLSADQRAVVIGSKRVIYDGFLEAVRGGVPKDRAGILVDEEFGAEILRDAVRDGYVTALSTETSGSDEFEFEYGSAFAAHIEAIAPTFAKVLVRYNPEGDAALNQRQTARLKQLSEYCRGANQRLMFELLVPATRSQLDSVQGDAAAYDLRLRPTLMVTAIRTLQDAGVEPDIWKVEGLDRKGDCERIVAVARRDGRNDVDCIVLGRGADEKKVVAWLETAASVAGFIGFAVGRTTFWDPVADYLAHRASREAAVARIAARYTEWAAIFEREQP